MCVSFCVTVLWLCEKAGPESKTFTTTYSTCCQYKLYFYTLGDGGGVCGGVIAVALPQLIQIAANCSLAVVTSKLIK